MTNGTDPILWPAKPYPLGETRDGEGVNCALFSEQAEKVRLCLSDRAGRRETHPMQMAEKTDQVWHYYLPEARPGLLYGYRVLLSGDAADETDERSQRIRDGNFIILMNAHHDEGPCTLPMLSANACWITLLDTSCQTSQGVNTFYSPGKVYPLQGCSLVLLGERASDRIRIEDRRRAQLP